MKYVYVLFVITIISCRPDSRKQATMSDHHDPHSNMEADRHKLIHKTGTVFDIDPDKRFLIDGDRVTFRKLNIIDADDNLVTAYQMYEPINYSAGFYFSYHEMKKVSGESFNEIIHMSNRRFPINAHLHGGEDIGSIRVDSTRSNDNISESLVNMYVNVYGHGIQAKRMLQYRKILIGEEEYFVRTDAEPDFNHQNSDTVYFETAKRLVSSSGLTFFIDELMWRTKYPPHSRAEIFE